MWFQTFFLVQIYRSTGDGVMEDVIEMDLKLVFHCGGTSNTKETSTVHSRCSNKAFRFHLSCGPRTSLMQILRSPKWLVDCGFHTDSCRHERWRRRESDGHLQTPAVVKGKGVRLCCRSDSCSSHAHVESFFFGSVRGNDCCVTLERWQEDGVLK